MVNVPIGRSRSVLVCLLMLLLILQVMLGQCRATKDDG